MATPRAAVLMTLGAGALFGTAGTAQALGPAGSSPIAVAALRLGLGGLVMAALLPLLGHRLSEMRLCLRQPLVWLSAVGSLFFQVLYFTGVDRAGVALGSLLAMGSIPVFAGLLGALLGHRVTAAWSIATVVAVAGLALLSLDGIGGGDLLGVVAALGSGLSGAIFVLATKSIITGGIPAVPANVVSYLIAALALLPVLVLAPQSLSWLASGAGVILALYIGFFAMALPNVLWVKGLGALSPGPSSTLMLAEPVVATTLGIVVLGETLAFAGIVGLVLVLCGLLLQGIALTRSADEEPLAPL